MNRIDTLYLRCRLDLFQKEKILITTASQGIRKIFSCLLMLIIPIECAGQERKSSRAINMPIPSLATTPKQDPLQEAIVALHVCLSREAIHYDDHVSDATTIAKAILAACFREADRENTESEMLLAKNGVAVDLSRPLPSIEKTQNDFALEEVLIERQHAPKKRTMPHQKP